jgi:hypothetical protein
MSKHDADTLGYRCVILEKMGYSDQEEDILSIAEDDIEYIHTLEEFILGLH